MAPKDFVNIDWDIQRASSVDSLEQTDLTSTTSSSLRFISGYHKWINTDEKTRVEKILDDNSYHHDNTKRNLIEQKSLSINNIERFFLPKLENEEEDINDENSLSHMDISINHFDVQLQVNDGYLEQASRYGVFSSVLSNFNQKEKVYLFKINQTSQTTEMDMENGDNNHGKTNGHSKHRKNNDENHTRNRQTNGSSNTNGNGYNNNSRRSNDDGSDGNDDDDDDDENENDDGDDDDTDENIARRLGFMPINPDTIDLINRLRKITNKNSFDRRDFETFQTLIDELIHIQHLETYSKTQLKQIIYYLKLYRPLQTKSRALIFLQERIPRRAVKYNVISSNNESNSNVFNIWRERERRARLDSKDSLEDDGQNLSGQQLRDVIEINHPTPPVLFLNNNNNNHNSSLHLTTKVKQMAKDIDTRSVSSRSELNLHTGERFSDHTFIPRSSSPTYPALVSVALYDIKSTNTNHNGVNGNHSELHLSTKRNGHLTNSSLPASSEKSLVQQLINRIETSSSSPTTTKTNNEKKLPRKKSSREDHSDGTPSITSSPPVKRTARSTESPTNGTNGHPSDHHSIPKEDLIVHPNQSHTEFFHEPHKNISNEITFQLDRHEIRNSGQRTASGTTIEEYVTNLLPGTETSVSMVRDVRARVYDDDNNALSRTDMDTIPVKVDVETLYILEQKSHKNFIPIHINSYISDHEHNSLPLTERHDSATQTTAPTSTVKPPHRPIGTQVDSPIEHHTVAAQTTDTLHRQLKERQRLPSSSNNDGEAGNVVQSTSTITMTTYKVKRRHSSHHTSEDEDDGAAVVYIDDKIKTDDYTDNFQLKPEKRSLSTDEHLPIVPEQPSSFGGIPSKICINKLRNINRHIVNRHLLDNESKEHEHCSSEFYEIHTRGACKCLVVSYDEKTQSGNETRFEKQLKRIERTYTDDELKSTALHVIVTSSDANYQLVKRDYGLHKLSDDEKENENIYEKSRHPIVSINYYTKEGNLIRTEHGRHLEHLPLVIRCEIEYELNHYGSAQLIILSVTHSERRQTNTSLKKELVDEIVSRSCGRLSANSPELEQEITRQLAEPTNLLHLVDYSSRDDYNQTNSNDLRRVSRIDVTTSLRLVQRYRTLIHRLCQLHRSHLRLTHQAEQQRHLILIARNEYYLFDLVAQTSGISTNISDIRQRQHDIFKREVNNVLHPPFDYAKYRRDAEQQQRILEQRFQQRQMEQKQQTHKDPPPPGHPSEAEFYLGTGRRALIEREIHSMRESIRPHEHAPPRYKYEPARRSLSICYSGGQRYVRARIIHVKDFYDDNLQHEQKQKHQRPAKEQELFVRIDDYINESAANSIRRSYSTDYLQEDGPRSRIRYIRIPGETIRIEEKTTYEYKGVMYANLPYSLRYWNILSILDGEARQGRPLGSTLPQVLVNDPYRTVIPPLTQHEIRQTAQQILSPQYNVKSYTDQTLRWFLSRDNRTEIESAKYLQTLHQYNKQQQQQQQQGGEQTATANKYYVTEKLVRYEKMPDRLVPVPINDRAKSIENISHRSPSIPRILHPPNLPHNHTQRSQSQPRPHYQSSTPSVFQTSQRQQQRAQLPPTHVPLSRHQSVHELHATPALSHPPSPSPSLRSLHSNQYQNRRPVAFNNRFPLQQQNPLLTEIIDSQTGRRILTTSQEQLPSEVLGLLNKYNLQQF